MDKDPIKKFNKWYAEAQKKVPKLPEACHLATANKEGKPSGRMVLLKGSDDNGFVFYTNYESRKGRQLAENPWAAITFHWVETGKQIRIEGRVEKTSDEESDTYFQTRDRKSQLAAIASKQSARLKTRFSLLREFLKYTAKYLNKPIERPSYWGGYRIIPSRIEFWENKDHRLHDRFLYTLEDNGEWHKERLSP